MTETADGKPSSEAEHWSTPKKLWVAYAGNAEDVAALQKHMADSARNRWQARHKQSKTATSGAQANPNASSADVKPVQGATHHSQ